MIKHSLTLLFCLIYASNLLHAQTLKNIHRKNLPTLHIPTHLIEKVETVVENNQRQVIITQTSGYTILIPAASIDSITHSEGQAVDPAQLGNLRTGSAFGIVRNDQGNPIANAVVKSAYSPHQTLTDANGVFFLNDFVVFDKLGFITVEKAGYFKGSRSFLPMENGANRVEIQLLPKMQTGSFNTSSGGQVTAGSLQLTFPANAIAQANGQPYTGTVNVFARALDPSAQEMFDQMPGDLLGGLNDSLQILRSFGMAAVELLGNSNEPLQLANGQNATLRFTIPASMLNEAPESIDWWSFDEEAGYWKHEGVAQKTGNEYIGQASHFSWWNCDVPEDFVELSGVVKDVVDNPISGAAVQIVSTSLGIGITYTNHLGKFSGRLPRNQILHLNIYLSCNNFENPILAYDNLIQTQTNNLNENYIVDSANQTLIKGVLVSCNGQPVSTGYVRMGNVTQFVSNGFFQFLACPSSEYTLWGYDTSNSDSVKVSLPYTFSLSNSDFTTDTLVACNLISGPVSDADGNIYSTVIIGNQEWMAENLKTTRYADGSLISNITSSIWLDINYGIWCNYENNSNFDQIYGKLYNWYVTIDSRNVCPLGWHVPSQEDWQQLFSFLNFSNVGGKLKSTTGWQMPNTGATNETGFSALPGGARNGIDNSFGNLSYIGYWWSSSSVSYDNARFVTMKNFENNVNVFSNSKKFGMSIRCVKD